jgi:hypothetical protein
MGLIFDTMSAYFAEHGWTTTRIGDSLGLSMTVQGDNGQWACIAQADEERRLFLFYSAAPVDVPAEKRLAVAEFITRANYNTLVGNFELDFEDGDLRYKTSCSVEGGDASAWANGLLMAQIARLVSINVFMMDQYLPGLTAVLTGEAPRDAIAHVEEEQHD